MKVGPDKVGIRYYSSHDLEQVKWQVRQRLLESMGMFPVKEVLVEKLPDSGIVPDGPTEVTM
ncbi:MAG: hypothetical protein C5B59_10030 [Bacteroidetes bacterium]|nr:MAG: hypothetical protein C5B59_10030 [Bacteroidota bacterium]